MSTSTLIHLNSQLEAVSLAIEVAELDKEYKELSTLLHAKRTALQTVCPHVETVKEEIEWPGSYYDRSSIEIRTYCKLCNKFISSAFDRNYIGSYA